MVDVLDAKIMMSVSSHNMGTCILVRSIQRHKTPPSESDECFCISCPTPGLDRGVSLHYRRSFSFVAFTNNFSQKKKNIRAPSVIVSVH